MIQNHLQILENKMLENLLLLVGYVRGPFFFKLIKTRVSEETIQINSLLSTGIHPLTKATYTRKKIKNIFLIKIATMA